MMLLGARLGGTYVYQHWEDWGRKAGSLSQFELHSETLFQE